MPYRGLTQKVVDFGKTAGYGIGRKKIKYTRNKVKPGKISVINRSMLGQGLRLAGSGLMLSGSGTRPKRLPHRLPSYF